MCHIAPSFHLGGNICHGRRLEHLFTKQAKQGVMARLMRATVTCTTGLRGYALSYGLSNSSGIDVIPLVLALTGALTMCHVAPSFHLGGNICHGRRLEHLFTKQAKQGVMARLMRATVTCTTGLRG
ncbi:hypothetical protein N7499_003190 [Penicillium canescens]|nr:hypothetical protein N7444_002927 [Penicillium canescens]KAJ6093859.1 hypothetical protein N7499_003190 [Penicillium canescens]KAJ6174355.1 hypothetical protein N7485_005421 [Penicillium canescens]